MRSPKVVGKSPEAKSLLLGFGSLLPHPSDIVFAEDALSRIMTFRFWHMVPIRFFKEGPCNPQILSKCWIFDSWSLFDVFSRAWNTHEAYMCTTLWPRPLRCEVSGPHFKGDTRSKLYRVKWTRRIWFSVRIAVTKVPSTLSTAYSRAGWNHSYQASVLLYTFGFAGSFLDWRADYGWGQVPDFTHRRDKSSCHFSKAYSRARWSHPHQA